MRAKLVPSDPSPAARDRSTRDHVERVILVDGMDRPIGTAGKLDVHRRGRLHRAFSVLIYNPAGDLLLQRRAEGKYHFAGSWSNSCCGHPRPGEETVFAARRRLSEELGIQVPLRKTVEFCYRANDPDSGLIEREYLHVFNGTFVGDPDPDPGEVAAWRWMSPLAIERALASHPDIFTPWFRLLVDRFLQLRQQ